MAQELVKVAPEVNALLETVRGMTLVHSQLLKEGFRFVYENVQQRAVVILTPKVYTDGAVIVDAINDLVLVLTVTTYDLEAWRRDAAQTEPLSEKSIELPYSTWFTQGNYR